MRKKTRSDADHYDRHGVLSEIDERAAASFSLDEELKAQILGGRRGRRLRNVSIKLDPVQVVALRKIATRKRIPYQTLIRAWLADGIRNELGLDAR